MPLSFKRWKKCCNIANSRVENFDSGVSFDVFVEKPVPAWYNVYIINVWEVACVKYIDEKFKEVSPVETIEKIKGILQKLGIETSEAWKESGLDNCWSLNLAAKGNAPMSNGKGVSEELARASAYAEFVERLQGGLFLYKYQDIIRKPEMYLQNYAPDVKYMTLAELEENGEWMDYIIKEYGGNITKKSLLELCKLHGCAEDGKIAAVPFYSLFEDKYVYLPIGFVDQVYATNGCCAGNTRDEAWVHALSEMMERRASLQMLLSGEAAPPIPQSVLERYPVVMNIINQIRKDGKFDIEILDYSLGNGFPVIAARLISKETQAYRVNVGADPVLEIAIERTLTELFQGQNVKTFSVNHNGLVIGKTADFPVVSNVINQLETSSGVFTADFFTEELTCTREPAEFADNSDKTNTELLQYMLEVYRALGKPVYVRNFSYLGFHSYRFVVPGFSEAKAVNLQDTFPEILASETSRVLKDIAAADDYALSLFMQHTKSISTVYGRYYQFGRLVGLPIASNPGSLLLCIARSYAAYRLGAYRDALTYLDSIIRTPSFDEDARRYFSCVSRYIRLTQGGIAAEKVRIILYKFFEKTYVDRLYEKVDNGLSPYEDYLFKCDFRCESCKYREACVYTECKAIVQRVGSEYQKFTNGQDRSEFVLP